LDLHPAALSLSSGRIAEALASGAKAVPELPSGHNLVERDFTAMLRTSSGPRSATYLTAAKTSSTG